MRGNSAASMGEQLGGRFEGRATRRAPLGDLARGDCASVSWSRGRAEAARGRATHSYAPWRPPEDGRSRRVRPDFKRSLAPPPCREFTWALRPPREHPVTRRKVWARKK